ncbi:hypothetical protein [Paracoccus sp. (in: a-proteobacteria)]|uniref:hypothetical protein n=1 Tax=Paracoccus sp. TaxID=267 RepID=UPI00272C779C|nr:hypothetical protein [Paracoccus sp. (in: a-proteobacteria)]
MNPENTRRENTHWPDREAGDNCNDPRTDESPGEGGMPSDMRYYRIGPKSGALHLVGIIGLPVAVIVLIVLVALVAF